MADTETLRETVKKAAKPAPKFEAPKIVVPEVFREMAEKSVEQARESYARIRNAAEEATDVVEDIYLQATRGLTEFNMKAIDALRENVNSSFDFARELLAAKSISDAVELSATHLRQRFEMLSAQAKDFSALAQKLAADTAEPMKTRVSRSLKLN
jgi:phasin